MNKIIYLMINIKYILTFIKILAILIMCSTIIFVNRRIVHEYRYGKDSKK